MKTIQIDRLMDGEEIKCIILDSFKWVHSYTVLTNSTGKTKGNLLVPDPDQNPDGNQLVEKRGHLYLRVDKGDQFIVCHNNH